MSEFECTFEQFKVMCKELMDTSKGATETETANGVKMLNLSLIYMNEPMWASSAKLAHLMTLKRVGVI